MTDKRRPEREEESDLTTPGVREDHIVKQILVMSDSVEPGQFLASFFFLCMLASTDLFARHINLPNRDNDYACISKLYNVAVKSEATS